MKKPKRLFLLCALALTLCPSLAGAQFALLLPPNGAEVFSPPTLEWAEGSYDYFSIYSVFYYRGFGYYPLLLGWYPITSLPIIQTWWDAMAVDVPQYWAVIGIRVFPLSMEIAEARSLLKRDPSDGIPQIIPDTGQDLCYDNTTEIECPVLGQPFYGQDAQYETNPMSYTVSPDELTVMDNVTGLVWQREGDSIKRTWSDAILYCESLTLGEYTGWRLPNEYELQSIVDYGPSSPAIDTTVFPSTNPTGGYWASSTTANSTDLAWSVGFYSGDVTDTRPKEDFLGDVRCVHGESTAQSFTDNLDGTVTDNTTGLTWQQEDYNNDRNWKDALAYCEALVLAGRSDWRLPDVKELRSIVDNTRASPAIDPAVFPGTNPTGYWTSSTNEYGGGSYTFASWYVVFSYGDVQTDFKTNGNYVRCVR